MNRGLVVASLAFVMVVGTVATPGLPAATAADGSGAPALQQDIDPDGVLMEVNVEENGDATWRIEYRIHLDTEEDEQAFQDLQSDIESNPDSYVERFHNRMNATAENAANATGREMTISNVTVSAQREELPQERGIVAFQFQWSNFAATDGDRLRVGDAIDGLFIDENTSLLITWVESHELVEASPSPTETREHAVTYDGPTNFATGEPRLELAPANATSTAEPVGLVSGGTVIIVAVVILLVLIAVGVLLWRRYGESLGGGATEEGPADSGDDTGAGAAGGVPDPDLLSNEEQVLQLIEQHGGRMKQQDVAEELGWTDAKTSQVTKGLREEGDLEGFRLGRENVLALPDEDVAEGDTGGENGGSEE